MSKVLVILFCVHERWLKVSDSSLLWLDLHLIHNGFRLLIIWKTGFFSNYATTDISLYLYCYSVHSLQKWSWYYTTFSFLGSDVVRTEQNKNIYGLHCNHGTNYEHKISLAIIYSILFTFYWFISSGQCILTNNTYKM